MEKNKKWVDLLDICNLYKYECLKYARHFRFADRMVFANYWHSEYCRYDVLSTWIKGRIISGLKK